MSKILLLHGALGAAEQLQPLAGALAAKGFQPAIIEFPGHGAAGLNGGGFTMEAFAEALRKWLAHHAAGVHVFGYSMGGYVAMLAAAQGEQRILSLYTLGTKWLWTTEYAAEQVKKLDAATIKAKVPAFAEALGRRHSALPWEGVLEQTAAMMQRLSHAPLLSQEDLSGISIPARITVGELDDTVSAEETARVAGWLPKCSAHTWPGLKHPLEKADHDLLAEEIIAFSGRQS